MCFHLCSCGFFCVPVFSYVSMCCPMCSFVFLCVPVFLSTNCFLCFPVCSCVSLCFLMVFLVVPVLSWIPLFSCVPLCFLIIYSAHVGSCVVLCALLFHLFLCCFHCHCFICVKLFHVVSIVIVSFVLNCFRSSLGNVVSTAAGSRHPLNNMHIKYFLLSFENPSFIEKHFFY